MQAIGLGKIITIVVRGALGSICGAVIYAIYGFSHAHHGLAIYTNLLIELPLWLLVMATTTWPGALASAGAGLFARSATKQCSLAALLPIAVVSMVASVLLFQWYMPKIVPSVSWSTAWLLPLASSLFAFVFASAPYDHTLKRTRLGSSGIRRP
jgi:hypothetical protein